MPFMHRTAHHSVRANIGADMDTDTDDLADMLADFDTHPFDDETYWSRAASLDEVARDLALPSRRFPD